MDEREANLSSDGKSDAAMAEQKTADSSFDIPNKQSQHSAKQKIRILQLHAEGHTYKAIAKHVGITRWGVYKVLKSTAKGKRKGPILYSARKPSLGPTPQQEKAILQLFAEDVLQDEIIRRVKVNRNTVTNVLLLHGKTFTHRHCAQSPAPLRATEKQKQKILVLLEQGRTRKQIAREVGISDKIAEREIFFAQRTERIYNNTEEGETDLPAIGVNSQNSNLSPGSDSDDHLPRDSPSTNRESSPEYAEPRASTSISPTFSDESSSGHGAPVVREAATNSVPDRCSPIMENRRSRSDVLMSTRSSVECSNPYSAGGKDYCDLSNAEDVNSPDLDRQKTFTRGSDIKPPGHKYRCDVCTFVTQFESLFISHLLGTKHAHLATKGVTMRCTACPFRTRQPSKMVGHVVTYKFHCLPHQADVYSIVMSS